MYAEPDAALGLLSGEGGAYAVLDVRDDDRAEGGHIKGSIWIPSFELDSQMESLVDQLIAAADAEGACEDAPLVVLVHCMFSQVRGPAAARKLIAHPRLAAQPSVTIRILRGGFLFLFTKYGSSHPHLFGHDDDDDDSDASASADDE